MRARARKSDPAGTAILGSVEPSLPKGYSFLMARDFWHEFVDRVALAPARGFTHMLWNPQIFDLVFGRTEAAGHRARRCH